MRRLFMLICLLALFGASGSLPSHANEGVIRVNINEPLGEISPYVYGANYGPWALLPVDLWGMAETSGITFFRFPGGEWGDRNDLSTNHIDSYIKFAQRMNAEPTISVRLRGGTPEKAAEMVRYVNLEHNYGVRYWSIGNEPNLYPDYDAETHAKDWRAFALAMRAVDPNILLIGPDISQYPPSLEDYHAPLRDWVRTFLKANADLVEVVSIHRYPFPKSMNAAPTTIAELRASAAEWEFIIPDLRQVVRESAGRDMPIAVMEVNSHWNKPTGGAASPDSYFNAIWWADVLARLIRQRVDMVAFWLLASYGENGPYGLFDRYKERPTFYVYPLYKRLGKQLVHAESENTALTVVAALTEDEQLTLMIVNPDDVPHTARLEVEGIGSCHVVGAWRLDPELKAEPIRISETAQTFDLPAYSATLYLIEPRCRPLRF